MNATAPPRSRCAEPDSVCDDDLAARALLRVNARADAQRLPVDARPIRQRRAQLILRDDARFHAAPAFAQRRDGPHAGGTAADQRAQRAQPSQHAKREDHTAREPGHCSPRPALFDQPQRLRSERDLANRADRAGGNLTRGEDAGRELADTPAEPERSLADRNPADGELADRHHAHRDLPDGDDPDRGRPCSGRRIDAADDVDQRQRADP